PQTFSHEGCVPAVSGSRLFLPMLRFQWEPQPCVEQAKPFVRDRHRIRSIPPPAVWLKWLIPRVSHDGFGMAADELAPEDLDAAGVVTRCDQDDAIASQFVKPFRNRAHLCGCLGISLWHDPNGRV